MSITDFMLIRAGVLMVLAFIWGCYCGLTGRPLWQEPRDKRPAAKNRKGE